jgi:hypothetical protein
MEELALENNFGPDAQSVRPETLTEVRKINQLAGAGFAAGAAFIAGFAAV